MKEIDLQSIRILPGNFFGKLLNPRYPGAVVTFMWSILEGGGWFPALQTQE